MGQEINRCIDNTDSEPVLLRVKRELSQKARLCLLYIPVVIYGFKLWVVTDLEIVNTDDCNELLF